MRTYTTSGHRDHLASVSVSFVLVSVTTQYTCFSCGPMPRISCQHSKAIYQSGIQLYMRGISYPLYISFFPFMLIHFIHQSTFPVQQKSKPIYSFLGGRYPFESR